MGPVGHSGTYKEFDLGFLLESESVTEKSAPRPIPASVTQRSGLSFSRVGREIHSELSPEMEVLEQFKSVLDSNGLIGPSKAPWCFAGSVLVLNSADAHSTEET